MVMVVPLSLSAADTNAAILRSKGGVWVNGAEVPDSTAVFPGASLETKPGFVASLEADGSSVLVQPESIIKFNGDSITLEHGSVFVATSTLLSVHVDCLRIVPASVSWTQYEVTDVNGTVLVAARKSDVNLEQGVSLHKPSLAGTSSQSGTVHEGEETTRNVSQVCGTAKAPSRVGSGVNTKWIEVGGGAAAGVIAICLLLCRGKNPPKLSPVQP